MVDLQREVVRPSASLAVAPFGGGLAVYDPVTEEAHILGPLESWIVSVDSPTTVGDLIDQASAGSGVPGSELGPRVVAAVNALREHGLLDRDTGYESPGPWPGSTRPAAGLITGVVHTVAADRIAFRSPNRDLLDEVDAYFGDGDPDVRPTKVIDIEPADDGGITVFAADEWCFPDRAGFFRQLVHVVNEYAARVDSVVALHAGAVRTPDGRVLVLPGDIDAGKTTITGALVRSGCDYASDEAVGVRMGTLEVLGYPKPLTVDDETRRLLGLTGPEQAHVPPRDLRPDVRLLGEDAGPIDEIVLVAYDPVPPGAVSRLDPSEALKTLVAHAFNLGRTGSVGLRTLCELAERVPVVRITHDDSIGLATELTSGPPRHSVEGTVLRHHPVDGICPARAPDAETAVIDAGGHAVGFVQRPGERVVVLDPLGTELWALLDGYRTITDLIEKTAHLAGSGRDGWRSGVHQLWALGQLGLLGAPEACWPAPEPPGAWPCPAGPWADSPRWSLALAQAPSRDARLARPRPSTPGEGRHRSSGRPGTETAVELYGHLVVTDAAGLQSALVRAVEAGVAVVADRAPEPSAAVAGSVIRVRALPGAGSGSLVAIGGDEAIWICPGCETATVACLLARTAAAAELPPAMPIAPTWVFTAGSEAVLHVGASPPDRPGTSHAFSREGWGRRFGALLQEGESIWIPDLALAEDWLRCGAPLGSAAAVMRRFALTTILVPDAPGPIDGWGDAVEALEMPGTPGLRHVVGRGRARVVVNDASGPLFDAPARSGPDPLAGDVPPTRSESPTSTAERLRRPTDPHPSNELAAWATELGTVGVAYESAKVDPRHVELARPLVRVDLRPSPTVTLSTHLGAFAAELGRLGLDDDDAADLAYISTAAGAFYTSEDRGPSGSLRRKFYVTEFPSSAWGRVAERWNAGFPVPVDREPSWLAWKVTVGEPALTKKAVEVDRLGGAATIGVAVDAVTVAMPPEWTSLLSALLCRARVDPNAPPNPGDLITTQDDGRQSVDLSVLARWPEQRPGAMEPELRWLCAVAGHGRAAADDLVTWAHSGRIARLIFGTDDAGLPFVNLYMEEDRLSH